MKVLSWKIAKKGEKSMPGWAEMTKQLDARSKIWYIFSENK